MIKARQITYLMISVSLLLLMQCSPTYRHKTLTVFFDGVDDTLDVVTLPVEPQKNATVALTPDSLRFANSPESKLNYHKPYQEHQCEKCHDSNSMGKLNQPIPDLCFTCHESFTTKYTFLHAPVASGYCLACHTPHMSENKKLLTRANENICYYCHSKDDVLQNKNHQVANVTGCTSCHNPHGGKDRYFSN